MNTIYKENGYVRQRNDETTTNICTHVKKVCKAFKYTCDSLVVFDKVLRSDFYEVLL